MCKSLYRDCIFANFFTILNLLSFQFTLKKRNTVKNSFKITTYKLLVIKEHHSTFAKNLSNHQYNPKFF